LRHDVGGELALEHRAHERRVGSHGLDSGDVGDERTIQPGRQFRGKVARLVGVRQEHVRRRQLPDHGLQRGGEAVGRIGLERRVFDGHDFGDLRGSELGPDACSVRPRNEDRDRRT
jgi:hypothetical protein